MHPPNLPPQYNPPLAATAPPPPSDDVNMTPASPPSEGAPISSAPATASLPTATTSTALRGSRTAGASRSRKKEPVLVSEYLYHNTSTGARHSLVISKARLPLFPGTVASAFRALQGSAKSPIELTRRIWLLYRGKSHLPVWTDAVNATRSIRRKVALPQPLVLLLQLEALPTNEWQRITKAWRTSAKPLSGISPGIRTNPNGFAGLKNYDIETADYIHLWMGGSMMAISDACGVEKLRDDVKATFLTTLTSLDLWPLEYNKPEACVLSPLLQCIKYTGSLKPATIATWLRDKVGLMAYDVVA